MNWFSLSFIAMFVASDIAQAQIVNWEVEPIRYSASEATRNPVARLQRAMANGELDIGGRDSLTRLQSLLQLLDIPVSSQVMVFSKTSLQDHCISQETPRAIYFNDEVFLGYVQDGLIEIATADPDLGAVFYTFDPRDEPNSEGMPRLQRQANRCLSCHGGARTSGVPGFQVRSVFPDTEGKPVVRAGSSLTNHRSPLTSRWGGWYVTGNHGEQHHLGGFVLASNRHPGVIDNTNSENKRTLPKCVDVTKYLTDTSDITALMVLEHQVEAYNLLTQANFVTQHVLWEASEKPLTKEQHKRIAANVQPLVDYLLFVEEASFSSPISGAGTFASDFVLAETDSNKRSLRQFDMQTRMFKTSVSYLLNSETFAQLHPLLQEAVKNAIWETLPDDRQLRAIVADCGPDWLRQLP